MRKIYMIIILMLTSVILSSCRHKETFQLLNEEVEISAISIVEISFDEEGEVIQTELNTIEDIDAFLDDFREVDCYTYFGDPTGITVEGVEANVIKILYENDEYELINWNGQADYTLKRGFRFYRGFSVFDETQFNSLISEYLQSEEGEI